MRIALVSPGDYPIPPIRGGSVEIYMHHLSQQLAKTHSLTIFSRGGSSVGTDGGNISYKRICPSRTLPFLMSVCAALQNEQFDVIQVDNRPVFAKTLRTKFKNTPVVLNLHSLTYLAPRRLTQSIARTTLLAPNAIVVNSLYLKRAIVVRWPFLSKRIHVIHPGVELSKFPSRHTASGAQIRQAERNKHKIGQDEIVFLFAGRCLPQKGIHVILQAFSRLARQNKKVRLWIVGGSQRAELTPYEKRIRSLAKGLPVKFFGFVTPDSLARIYLASDIFLCPSQSSEAYGMVNVEAAASGLPAIGSKAWGIKESIAAGISGIHVTDYRSPAAWKNAMQQLADNSELRIKLSQSAVRWAKSHSWARVAKQFSQLYSKL